MLISYPPERCFNDAHLCWGPSSECTKDTETPLLHKAIVLDGKSRSSNTVWTGHKYLGLTYGSHQWTRGISKPGQGFHCEEIPIHQTATCQLRLPAAHEHALISRRARDRGWAGGGIRLLCGQEHSMAQATFRSFVGAPKCEPFRGLFIASKRMYVWIAPTTCIVLKFSAEP